MRAVVVIGVMVVLMGGRYEGRGGRAGFGLQEISWRRLNRPCRTKSMIGLGRCFLCVW